MKAKERGPVKYRDLVQFKPIASVIQVLAADEQQKAAELVETYVMSDRMAREIKNCIVPHLQFEQLHDNRGLFIVGNYGTGKSHLMAVLSTVAENPEVLPLLNHQGAAETLTAIAGKFGVIRMELGGTQITVRDAVCQNVEKGLQRMGVDHQFPAIDKITNNKESFLDMMGKFNQAFPSQGLLVVIDELLDFLRTRHQQDLVLDLNFLRELGEISAQSRFRIMAGTQEVLFGNPQFQFATDSMQRVSSRFQEVHIVNDDVAFVVAHRILGKSPEQKAWVRSYLEKYAPLFESLSLKLEQHVDLFPVNPDFFHTFENIHIGEKREILRTVTEEMRDLLDEDVPEGLELLSVDRYWDYLARNSAFTSDPNFQRLKQRVDTAIDKVQSAMAPPAYVPLAVRIIKGLAIHRLTVGFDIRIGLTAKELKDSLALYIPVPMQEASFLERTIESIVKDVTRILGHQLVVSNPKNGQYYIDMGEYIDLDAILQDKALNLGDDILNQYYFDVLATLLERKAPYVPGNRIWQFDVPWNTHHVERPGYLFFGTPRDRTTAQPPREFYCYFLPPFGGMKHQLGSQDDEVFFRVDKLDEDFADVIRHHAAARELALGYAKSSMAGDHFKEQADRTFKLAGKWLREHFGTHVHAIHQQQPFSVVSVLREIRVPADATLLETVASVNAHFLEDAFSRQLPDYPVFEGFSNPLTPMNLREHARHAIDRVAGRSSSNVSTRVLESLALMDGDKIRPRQSPYAQWILSLTDKASEPHHVVNRKDLLEIKHTRDGVEDIVYTKRFHLEPELLMVVFAALIYSGDLLVVIDKVRYGPERLAEFSKMSDEKLLQFSHVEQPAGIALPSITALFEFFQISPVYAQNESKREDGVPLLQQAIVAALNRLIPFEQFCHQDIRLFGESLLTSEATEDWQKRVASVKTFLEQAQNYNTAGKLAAFVRPPSEVDALAKEYQVIVSELGRMKADYDTLNPIVTYLEAARAVLPPTNAWQQELDSVKTGFILRLQSETGNAMKPALEQVRVHYIKTYWDLHQRHRLTKIEDDRRQNIIRSAEWQALDALSTMGQWLDGQAFRDLRDALIHIPVCIRITESDLKNQVECPHCHFRPVAEHATTKDLNWFESQVEVLTKKWTGVLVDALSDPGVAETLRLFDGENRAAIQSLVKEQVLPLPVPRGFVDDLKTVLQGIHATEISVAELLDRLGSGTPFKPDQVIERLEQILDQYIAGHERERVRIIFRP